MVKSIYTCKRFWKYKNLILKFSFLKRARQTFKASYFIQLAGGGGVGKGWGNFCLGDVLAHIDKGYTPCKSACVCIFFAFLATAEELNPEGKVPSMLRTGTEYEASGSTRDIHELQAALQAAQLTATGTGSRYSGKINFLMKTLI